MSEKQARNESATNNDGDEQPATSSDATVDNHHPSRLYAGMAGGGQFRWVAAELTDVVRSAQMRLDMGPVASIAFGRCAAAASMLVWLTSKTPRRLTLDVRGSGALGHVLAEVSADGSIRGMVGDAHATGPEGPEDLSVAEAIGIGLLRVRREDNSSPDADGESQILHYESQVELVTSEIGSDVAYYLKQSEQRRCAIAVGVDVGPRGIVAAAGFLVEALPDASEEAVAQLEQSFRTIDPISRTLPQLGPQGVAEALLGEISPTGEHALQYRCRCSADRLAERLSSMPASELATLSVNDAITAECAYCGAVYEYSEAELLSAGTEPN